MLMSKWILDTQGYYMGSSYLTRETSNSICCWILSSYVYVMFRDVYHIESILSYRYHKTGTGIVSKWKINVTFNDTFYDDINKDRASLTQKWMIFFIKCMFCFSFLHHLENYGPWILLYCMLSIPKVKRKKVNVLMVWYRIYPFCQYRYCIV